jgi:nicotinamidase-related amidase
VQLDQLAISPRRAALVVIDVQERLAAAMPADVREKLERNVVVLLEAARRFSLPVVVSEQYPKGLGPTTTAVAAAVEAAGPLVHRIEKLEFSVCDHDAFAPLYTKLGRDQWIVTGMEAHVCVWQTVRGLVGRGAAVHVVQDAVASRTQANWKTGLKLARSAGAAQTSTEVVVFDLLGRAGTEDFKALSKLIK